ncbi:hypothetical protein ACIOWF_20590 [Cellulosimicrobium cellulans]|uniref:hypothetical protein n=1 Tax=Cellulosimicrobium cellulans TaxID=1710 RepID=UPI0038227CA0
MSATRNDDQSETVEAAAARYEAVLLAVVAARYEAACDARDLAQMLAPEQVDRNAVARQNERASMRNQPILDVHTIEDLGPDVRSELPRVVGLV